MGKEHGVAIVQIYCITYCQDEANLYGTTLTFKTLRTGFPNANVHVIDNGSLLSVRPAIHRHVVDVGATWTSLPVEVGHWQIIQSLIMEAQSAEPIVFIDPDLVFWSDVSTWMFPEETLIAGREIPSFHDPYTKAYTHRRLHTSFLWVPRPHALQQEVISLRKQYFEWDPFKPVMLHQNDRWERLDTMGALYHALPVAKTKKFTTAQLESYDHLFAGTIHNVVSSNIPPEFRRRFDDTHRAALKGALNELKGIWKEQDRFFASFAESAHVTI